MNISGVYTQKKEVLIDEIDVTKMKEHQRVVLRRVFQDPLMGTALICLLKKICPSY